MLFLLSCQTLQQQPQQPLVFSSDIPIQEHNKQVETWFKQHPEAACLPQWSDSLALAEFDEVDDWLAPLDINGSIYVWSLKPKGKEKFYYQLADSFYHMREYETARSYYLKTLEINPNNWFASLYLGDTFFIGDEFDTAGYWFKKSISINSYNWKNWKYLADWYNSLDMKNEAIDATIRSILFNPYNFESWSLLAYLGRKYNFEVWNPQDSVFMRSFQEDSTYFVLYRQNSTAENNHLFKMAAQNLFLNINKKQYLPDSLTSEIFTEHPLHHHLLNSYVFAYKIFAENWSHSKPKENADELYTTYHLNEYIEENDKLDKLPLLVYWTDILRIYPHAALYLKQEEVDELVQFFYDNYLLINF